ncbi:MAG: LTA synthase family protein [Prevotellaceae bacterium]|nr:LTA synthase family protein [Prevotellaceae bacterium]
MIHKDLKFYLNTFLKLIVLSLSIGFFTRIVLLFNEQTEAAFSLINWLSIFLLGAVNDLFFTIIACGFIWLYLTFLSEWKYKTPWGYIIFAIFALSLFYVSAFHTIFDDYGSVVPAIVMALLGYKLVSFGLRLFVPSVRVYWRQVAYSVLFFVYVLCLTLNAFSEYFFWSEFGVRYNFIAVDYLIYTNEVIGNIFESYPIIPLFGIVLLITFAVAYVLLRKLPKNWLGTLPRFYEKTIFSVAYFALFVIACLGLNFSTRFQSSGNLFADELQANGAFKFYTAFLANELDYATFYNTLPEKEAFELLYKEYGSSENNLQQITDALPEIHKNIILITMESLSADFMEKFGNTNNITPNLDSLYNKSLAFNNLFATGNRTVRGLEAVTVALPPSAGQSLVKRPNNENLYSTASILKERGYTTQYFYGGDSYFDNMGTFFRNNNYEIIDEKSFAKDEITFQNIWGVCDEDIYKKAIAVFNENAKTGKPFFGHIMTVSNHRPFTYPEGKIDISGTSKSRNGGVKYADYAIGIFMEMAKKEAWFENTVFVIMADHCASSAGKTEIPLNKYHIPALIYAPDFVQPQQIETLTSQIDIMPTVFGLLHFSYNSHFYGKNIFAPDYKPRALVATYQNLGYWQQDIFTILSPTRKVEQYKVNSTENFKYEMTPLTSIDSICFKYAAANYQTANILVKRGEYKTK